MINFDNFPVPRSQEVVGIGMLEKDRKKHEQSQRTIILQLNNQKLRG